MPQFVIERDVPGVHKLTDAEVQAVARKSVEALTSLGPQIQWVQSYVTENKIYCVYLAPDEAIIREHAKRAGVPADRIAAVRRLISVFDAERA
jgi:hypothetical protein